MMVLLINKAHVSKILQVAIGYNSDEFDVFIREAQDFDLKPLLLEDFYYELMEKKDQEEWKLLIDGGQYVYNGKPRSFRGLGDVLAYFSYARFYRKSGNVSTSHGLVNKTSPHSVPLTTEEKNNMYYKYKKDANIIFEDFRIFMDRKSIDYPSWNMHNQDCGPTARDTGFKTHVIK